jgi:hypothetical protein
MKDTVCLQKIDVSYAKKYVRAKNANSKNHYNSNIELQPLIRLFLATQGAAESLLGHRANIFNIFAWAFHTRCQFAFSLHMLSVNHQLQTWCKFVALFGRKLLNVRITESHLRLSVWKVGTHSWQAKINANGLSKEIQRFQKVETYCKYQSINLKNQGAEEALKHASKPNM